MRKTVLVLTSGAIPELGNVSGPISTPTRIDVKSIVKLVKNGKKVVECNPADPWNESKRVELTVSNAVKDNFSGKENSVVVEEKKEETQVNTTEESKETVETPVEKESVNEAEAVEDEVETTSEVESNTTDKESVSSDNKQNNYQGNKKNKKRK